MGIPTPALIAIIVGKYILSSSCNTSYCWSILERESKL
jgi:hypothetical protein